MATLEILEEKITPRAQAIRDMREAPSIKSSIGTFEGLDTTVLALHKTVIVEEIEEFILVDGGHILNRSKRIKRTITSETIHL